jgi:uncharacterized protein
LNQTLISTEVIREIGPFYVYVLVDPITDEIFYVGKGSRQRAESHLKPRNKSESSTPKMKRIRAIRSLGEEPRIDIVQRNLPDGLSALQFERALIDCLPNLTNLKRGHGVAMGRESLKQIAIKHNAPELGDCAPVSAVLIRLGDRWVEARERMEPKYFRKGYGWKEGIERTELYDAVRGWWHISPTSAKRRKVSHAVAVYGGVTLAVYRIDKWIGPKIRTGEKARYAFQGEQLTSGPVFDFYVGRFGKRVPFKKHSQNSIYYWPPK